MAENELIDLLSSVPRGRGFTPYCHFDEKSDAITAYFRGDADYSKRLTDHVTLFLSIDSDEIVGCRIKGIRGILEDLPNYLEISHCNVQLSVLFLSFRGNATDESVRHALNTLAKESKGLKLVCA